MTMGIAEIIFFLVGAVAIASAFGVILHPHPVYSALSLVVALFQIAVLFILLDAQMVAFLQVLVYAGAIMVLFLFVIMLLGAGDEVRLEGRAGLRSAVALIAVAFVAEIGALVVSGTGASTTPTLQASFGGTRAIAERLFTTHLLSFELTSVLLLVAVVGAVVMARRKA